MNRVLILAGSPRKDGNSASLAASLAEGAIQSGCSVEIVHLADRKINYCLGCDYCRNHCGVCIHQDDMPAVLTLIEAADVIVFATPLYFLSFSAQLKTCIDRFYCRHHAGTLAGKAGVLIVTSGGGSRAALASFFSAYQAMLVLLHWQDKGVIWAGGYRHDGSILESASIVEARALGASLGD
jgi:multimeric flavodoxin WrbA